MTSPDGSEHVPAAEAPGSHQAYGSQPPPYGQQSYPPPYQPQPYPPQFYAPVPPQDGMSIAAMVVGIASLVMACGYGVGLLGSPVALVLGLISKRRIDRSNGQLAGRGFAVAGFVLGIVGTVLLAIGVVGVIVFVIAAFNGLFDESYVY